MACLTENVEPEQQTAAVEVEAKDAERLSVAWKLSRQESYPCHRISKVAESMHSIISGATTMSVYVSDTQDLV